MKTNYDFKNAADDNIGNEDMREVIKPMVSWYFLG